jgi:hypothetical protein
MRVATYKTFIKTALINIGLLCVSIVAVDITIGALFCKNDVFRGHPLPPFDLFYHQNKIKKEYEIFQDMLQKNRHQLETQYYGCLDNKLGWAIRKNASSKDGLYVSNSEGIRSSREYNLITPPGVTRIAAFGDSFTHGDEVPNKETWEYLLEQSRDKVEVMNFGVQGYGTDQAYLRYKRDGIKYHPDIVLIGFMLENILRNVNIYRLAYQHGEFIGLKPRFEIKKNKLILIPLPFPSIEESLASIGNGKILPYLLQNDYWVKLAPFAYENSLLFYSSCVRILFAYYEKYYRNFMRYYFNTHNEPFQVTTRLLTEFYTQAKKDGAKKVCILIFPDKNSIKQYTRNRSPYWKSLLEYLEAHGVDYIDFTEELMQESRRTGLQAMFNGEHYSINANRVIQKTLSKKFFPCD